MRDQKRRITSGSRQDHVGVLRVGGDLRDPAIMADELAPQQQSLGHGCDGRTTRPTGGAI